MKSDIYLKLRQEIDKRADREYKLIMEIVKLNKKIANLQCHLYNRGKK